MQEQENREESPVVCIPAKKTLTKMSKKKKLESHQTKLSDFGTKRIDLRLETARGGGVCSTPMLHIHIHTWLG